MSRGEIMKYQNNSIDALLELERQRTGNYGSDYDIYCEDDLTAVYDEYDKADEEYDERMCYDG